MEYLQKVNWYKEMEELFSVAESNNDKKDYLEYFQQKTPLDDVFFTTFPSELCKDLNDLEQISKFSGKKLTGKCGEMLDLANNSNSANEDNLKKRKLVVTEDPSYMAKKEHHNYIEKKRRKKINSELDQLKELNPYCKNATANKLSILHFTCEYIQNLQDSYKKLLDTNRALKDKNDKVQVEIREFQKFMLQTEEISPRPAGYPAIAPTLPASNSGLRVNCPPPVSHPPQVNCPPPQAMNPPPAYVQQQQQLQQQHEFIQPPIAAPYHMNEQNYINYNNVAPHFQQQVAEPHIQHSQHTQLSRSNPRSQGCNYSPEAQFRPPANLQQQQQLKLQMAHHQQQQHLQQLQQRLHVPPGNVVGNGNGMPQVNPGPSYQQSPQGASSQQQTPKRTTWTFTQIPSH